MWDLSEYLATWLVSWYECGGKGWDVLGLCCGLWQQCPPLVVRRDLFWPLFCVPNQERKLLPLEWIHLFFLYHNVWKANFKNNSFMSIISEVKCSRLHPHYIITSCGAFKSSSFSTEYMSRSSVKLCILNFYSLESDSCSFRPQATELLVIFNGKVSHSFMEFL